MESRPLPQRDADGAQAACTQPLARRQEFLGLIQVVADLPDALIDPGVLAIHGVVAGAHFLESGAVDIIDAHARGG